MSPSLSCMITRSGRNRSNRLSRKSAYWAGDHPGIPAFTISTSRSSRSATDTKFCSRGTSSAAEYESPSSSARTRARGARSSAL